MSGPERTVMFQLPTVVSGQVVCVEGTVAGRSWDLSAGTFVIGRKEGCDLHLPAEPGVSKVHCKIVAEGTNYRLSDAESRNGTILNGMPTQSAVLNDGDLIQVCGCKLRFSQTGDGNAQVRNPPAASPLPEVTDPVQMSPGYDEPPAAGPPMDATVPDQEPAFELPPVTDATRAAPPAPATVEVRGSTLWSFFTGLFAMLICGGGAYAALLYTNDGQLPPPGELLGTPEGGDGDPVPTDDPAGDGDNVDPVGDGDAKPGDGDATDPSADPAATGDGDKTDPAGDGDATVPDPAQAAGDGDAAPGDPDPEPEKVVSTTKTDPAPTGRRRTRRTRKKVVPEPEPEVAPASDPEPETAKEPDPEPAAEPAVAAVPAVESEWFKVTYVPPGKKPVRVPSGGRVKSVDVADGDLVKRGQVLARVESASSSPAEIATKKESIRALKSIVEASGDPEALKLLNEEEDALKRMLASSKNSQVVAPITGKLEGFRVKSGETLRSRLVVGFVRSQAEPVLEVTVPKAVGTKVKAGAAVSLKVPGGTEEGVVKGKPSKRGKTKYKVTIVAGGVDLSDVTEAQLP